jgi:hypothetical protein
VIHLDPHRKSEAIHAGFMACQEELEPYKESYFKTIDSWNPVAVCDDDKVIGALIHKDNIIHLAIVKEYRCKWASKRIIQEMLKYGKMTNAGSSDDFVERIGFKRIGDMYQYPEAASCRS